MSPTIQRQCLNRFCLKIAVIFMVYQIPLSFAFGDIFVMNASKIEHDCVAFCDTSQVDYVLNIDCQRGCRFFETFNAASIFAQFDDMVALKTCHQSCSEAYVSETRKRMACSDGCINAQRAYNKIYSLSLQWLQDLHQNMTFFETLLDMTSAVVNSRRSVDVPIRIKKTDKDKNTLPAKREPAPIQPQLTTIVQANLSEEHNGAEKPLSTVPDWIAQSAFVLFTLGIVLLLGVCCYCCIFAHFLRHNQNKNVDTELPPSYEELIRNSYVLISPSRTNHYHYVKNNKQDESCSTDVNSIAEDTIVEAALLRSDYY